MPVGGNGGGGSGGGDDKPGSTSGLKRPDRAVISGGYATTVASGEVEHPMQSLRDDVEIALESFGGLVRGLS
jgi:hypothetical protein